MGLEPVINFSADDQDRAQVSELAKRVQEETGETVEIAYVDQGYTGENAANAAGEHGIRLEVVKLPTAKRGFVLLPRRWVVERSFGWVSRFRRLARDYERLPENSGRTALRSLCHSDVKERSGDTLLKLITGSRSSTRRLSKRSRATSLAQAPGDSQQLWSDSPRPHAGSDAYPGRFPDFFTGFISSGLLYSALICILFSYLRPKNATLTMEIKVAQ